MQPWEPSVQVMIRYKLKPGEVERNLELLRAVYADLATANPEGLRYGTFQLDDRVSFVAFTEFDDEPGAAPHHLLASFPRNRASLDERCAEPPVAHVLRDGGAFRLPHSPPAPQRPGTLLEAHGGRAVQI